MLKQLIDIQCYNMKTKKLKRVPQYAFGADAISNWGNMSGVDKANVVTQGVGAVGSMEQDLELQWGHLLVDLGEQ